jgi:hypothetical protein
MNLDEFLTQPLVKPLYADCIDLEYEGIKFHVYGILHGITGGTNREYVSFVNNTINQATGLKLGEKSMLKMYKGLDAELDDWFQMPNKDTFLLTLKLLFYPQAVWNIIRTTIKEKIQKLDKFDINNRRMEDLGGSPYFHLLDPYLRREYLGFPTSENYFIENFNRRKNKLTIKKVVYFDPDWKWLTYIERFVNMPYRSVHMIEFAVKEAKKRNVKEVSLFIGETHHSDIAWYVNRKPLSPELEKEIEDIKEQALNGNKYIKKLSYLLSASLAACIPAAIILMILSIYNNLL